MSTGSFNCIFCTETFESREELQVHFRKHGDPNLHARLKTGKKREAAAGGVSTAAPTALAKQESVSCDVCDEIFPTIAKAITHKHKFHPDYSIKHFCPWCGKLFPIKHLSDKHSRVHGNAQKPTEVFRCDECAFEFYTSAAVSYHNRSFHRADAPAPHLVGSRKYRLINKDLVQLFFCHLCGGEYINSINLQKHVVEQHCGQEWAEPGAEVLRCPRCDVVFHSQAAYVTHLSHHTPADVYVHTLESLPELEEFTLETVPPIIEKMETPIQVDLEQMMSVDMDVSGLEGQDTSEPTPSPDSSATKKPAPRKAITLNQFLSMNKDVFGDVFNCQGVEEVPSRMVANQMRPKRPRLQPVVRPGTKIMSAENIQKLKQQGVVVKAPIRKPVTVSRAAAPNGLVVGKPIRIATGAMQSAQPRFSQPRPVLQKVVKPPGMRPAAQPPGLRPAAQPQGVRPTTQPPGVRQAGQPPGVRPAAQPLGVRPTAQPQGVRPAAQPQGVRPAAQPPGVRPAAQPPGVRPAAQPPGVRPAAQPPGVRPAAQPPGMRPVAPPKQVIGKPLKILPSAARPTVRLSVPTKKPAEAETSAPGPFSCFKKPKESLIPISDVPGVAELLRSEPSVSLPPTKLNVTSAVPAPKSSITSSLPVAKTTVTSAMTVARPVASTVSNARPVASTTAVARSSSSSVDNSDSDSNKSKKTAPLEALEKLRKQGLLVKKPKMDSEGSRESSPASDAPCLTVKSGG